MLESVANHARFDVFRLDRRRARRRRPSARSRCSQALKGEGVAPTLVSWALSREIVLLARLQYAAAHGESLDAAMQRMGVWRRRQPLVKQAIARYRRHDFRALVSQSAAVDGMIKGVTEATPWEALTGLLIALLQPVARH